MEKHHKELRKRLLNWHYSKSRRLSIVDLLQSNYQGFRYRVEHRLKKENKLTNNERLDFRDAIKLATFDELAQLDNFILEERLGI